MLDNKLLDIIREFSGKPTIDLFVIYLKDECDDVIGANLRKDQISPLVLRLFWVISGLSDLAQCIMFVFV